MNFYALHKLTGELLTAENKLAQLENEEYQLKKLINETKNSITVTREKLDKIMTWKENDNGKN